MKRDGERNDEQIDLGAEDAGCIEPDRFYRPSDPSLRKIATVGTLAHWRHRGLGPPYVRYGNRVLYRGRDVLAWLEGHTVYPTDSRSRKSAGGSEAA